MSASISVDLNTASGFETCGFDVAAHAALALRDRQSLAATLDHTILHPSTTSNDVIRACEEGARYGFACVLVNPCWTALAHSALAGTGVVVGTVVGYPLGASLTRTKREEGDAVLRLGARELEMVMKSNVQSTVIARAKSDRNIAAPFRTPTRTSDWPAKS